MKQTDTKQNNPLGNSDDSSLHPRGAQHTPTPWHVGRTVPTMIFCSAHPTRSAVAEVLMNNWDNHNPWISQDTQAANAALIVEAVNNFARLERQQTRAIKYLVDAMGSDAVDGCPLDEMCALIISQRDNAEREGAHHKQQAAHSSQEIERLLGRIGELETALRKFVDTAEMQQAGGDSMLKIQFNGPALFAARQALARPAHTEGLGDKS